MNMNEMLEKVFNVMALVAALSGVFGFISEASAALFAVILLAIGELIGE